MRLTCAAATTAVLVVLLIVAPARADPAAGAVAYQPPVPGPVIDPYRPPSTPYGPGNLGIDYATTPGEAVGAVADGEVVFAGPVGGSLHVVVLHADGIRTSLSFLAGVLVRRGQRVAAGQQVGWAAASLHLGARRGAAYLDPATLLAGAGSGRAVLVPEDPGRPLATGEEAAGLLPLLRGGGPARTAVAPSARAVRPPTDGPGPASGRLRRVVDVAGPAPPVASLAALGALAGRRRHRDRRGVRPGTQVARGGGGRYPG